MSTNTSIEWTEATYNPFRGTKGRHHCVRVSPGCKNCYAAAMNVRFKGPDYVVGADTPRLDTDALLLPLRWKKPRRVFVCSMTDLFLESHPVSAIAAVFGVMASAPRHEFQILTKRPARMREFFRGGPTPFDCVRAARRYGVEVGWPVVDHGAVLDREAWPLPNVWLGVSCENQQTADERIPLLLQTPAAIRWVSAEPLLGRIDFTKIPVPDEHAGKYAGHGHTFNALRREDDLTLFNAPAHVDWIVAGGESGRGARPMHPHWPAIIRNQCADAGVPFFFKQWGEWQEGSVFEAGKPPRGEIVLNNGRHARFAEDFSQDERNRWPSLGASMMAKVGKKAAGRTLDGREWSEYPRVGVAT